MFKKISHIILAVLIIMASSGMIISKHYCGSSLKSISLFSTPKSCCEIPVGCCHDETLTLKVKDEFAVTYNTFEFLKFAIEAPVFVELCQATISIGELFVSYDDSSPPPNIHTLLSLLQTYRL